MIRGEFEGLCQKAGEGYDVLIDHPSSNEIGHIVGCSLDDNSFQVQTAEGNNYSWSASECEVHTREAYPCEDIWEGFPDEGYPHNR